MSTNILDRYATGTANSKLCYMWKTNVKDLISKGLFTEFVSANSEAKQFIVSELVKSGKEVVVTKIGCGVDKITVKAA